ncbi:MAG: hypothetical protein AAF350_02085 [Pseudomonadota bacterium]
MARLYPDTIPASARAIYEEMRALAGVALPEWHGVAQDGEVGFALFRALATLAEQSEIALSKTAARDAIEFFNYLDVPAEPARPAEVAVAFQLGEQARGSVDAPAGVRVGASTDDGEVLFETASVVRVVNSRLDVLASVDDAADRIELAPGSAIAFGPQPPGLTRFTIPTLTATGGRAIQVEPPEGLEQGDYIRFDDAAHDGAVYRVDEGKDGLFTLLDALEANVQARTAVEKLTTFEAFRMRDVQAHRVFIGHADLLNLEQPATIRVTFEPASVADLLAEGPVVWSVFGTKLDEDGDDVTDWHDLDATYDGGVVVLTKRWLGSVDETEVPGAKSRWLRAEWQGAYGRGAAAATVSRVRLAVESLAPADLIDSERGDAACCRAAGAADTNATTVTTSDTGSGISQAFHNNLALPLTTRFYPFGPEPQRFDTFALAAPEAFSKKGATVRLGVRLSDASISSLAVGQSFANLDSGPRRAFAVGDNGHLQLLIFEEITPEWIDLAAPGPDNQRAGSDSETSDRLLLDPTHEPQAMQYDNIFGRVYDAVVVRDRRHGLWARQVGWTGGPPPVYDEDYDYWSEFAKPGGEDIGSFMTLYHENAAGSPYVSVVAIIGGGLQHVRAMGGGFSGQYVDWMEVTSPQQNPPAPAPSLGASTRLVRVESMDWPRPAPAAVYRVFVHDEDDALWIGTLSFDYTRPSAPTMEVAWIELTVNGPDPLALSRNVVPVAYAPVPGTDEVIVYAARIDANSDDIKTVYLDIVFDQANATPGGLTLRDGARFGLFPGGFGDPVARVIVTGSTGGADSLVELRAGEVTNTTTLPADVVNPAPVALFPLGDVPLALLGGATENLYLQLLPDPVNVTRYRDALVLSNGIAIHDFIGKPPQPGGPQRDLFDLPDAADVRIVDGTARVFEFPANQFDAADWTLWELGTDYDIRNEGGEFYAELAPAKDDYVVFQNKLSQAINVGPSAPAPWDNSINVRKIDFDHAPSIGDGNTGTVSEVIERDTITAAPQHQGALIRVAGLSLAHGDPDRIEFRDDYASPATQRAIALPPQAEGNQHWLLLSNGVVPPAVPAPVIEAFTSSTNALQSVGYPRNFQNPELAWEYFDGDGWRRFGAEFVDRTENFARSRDISFEVPTDLSPVEIAGQEDYFIRARLIGGDYGRPVYQVESSASGGVTTQSVTVDTSGLQPPEIRSITATFALDESREPEQVRVLNNLTSRDQSQAAVSPQAQFALFEAATALSGRDGVGRALYLGFTQAFGPGDLSLYVDALDAAGDEETIVEALSATGWQDTPVQDQTQGLRRRGFLRVTVSATPVLTRLLGQDRYWLRVRLRGDGATWNPVINSVTPNAVRAVQSTTTRQELLGSSTGEPNQVFNLGNPPVLPDSIELRVREDLSPEAREALVDQLGRDVVARYPDIDLGGDWVLWHRVDSFLGFGADDRVYRLDAQAGVIRFGEETARPPAGRDNVRAIGYRSGGGVVGNVTAHAIANLKSSLRGVDAVTNPVAAAGGSDTPPVEDMLIGAPARIRRAGRALMPVDIEALVESLSPDIVRARCVLPTAGGDPIRVVVVRRGEARCPRLALAERDGIRRHILNSGWGGLAARDVEVVDPDYVAVHIKADLVATIAEHTAALRAAAIDGLATLLNPVDGGPDGTGWPFGRMIWRADLLRLFARLPFFDAVVAVEVLDANGQPLNAIGADALICGEPAAQQVNVVARDGQGAAGVGS